MKVYQLSVVIETTPLFLRKISRPAFFSILKMETASSRERLTISVFSSAKRLMRRRVVQRPHSEHSAPMDDREEF